MLIYNIELWALHFSCIYLVCVTVKEKINKSNDQSEIIKTFKQWSKFEKIKVKEVKAMVKVKEKIN